MTPDWERPASAEILDGAKQLGLTFSDRQRAQSRDDLVDCDRPLTFHEAISAAPISVKGDTGPCYAIALSSNSEGTEAPSPTPYVLALCYPTD